MIGKSYCVNKEIKIDKIYGSNGYLHDDLLELNL